MHPSRVLALTILAMLALAGCQTPAPPTGTVASASPADGGDAAPMNDKERLQAEQWQRSTAGLSFAADSGLVEVERIPGGSAQTAAPFRTRADELFATNHVMDAMEQYALAARHDPSRSEPYIGLGITLQRKGRTDSAITSYRTAIDRDDRNLEARYRLADALWTATRQDEAIEEMRLVLDLDEEFGRAHERLAVWSYYVGEHADAWRHLHRAEALGQAVPAQLAGLLEKKMPDPGAS